MGLILHFLPIIQTMAKKRNAGAPKREKTETRPRKETPSVDEIPDNILDDIDCKYRETRRRKYLIPIEKHHSRSNDTTNTRESQHEPPQKRLCRRNSSSNSSSSSQRSNSESSTLSSSSNSPLSQAKDNEVLVGFSHEAQENAPSKTIPLNTPSNFDNVCTPPCAPKFESVGELSTITPAVPLEPDLEVSESTPSTSLDLHQRDAPALHESEDEITSPSSTSIKSLEPVEQVDSFISALGLQRKVTAAPCASKDETISELSKVTTSESVLHVSQVARSEPPESIMRISEVDSDAVPQSDDEDETPGLIKSTPDIPLIDLTLDDDDDEDEGGSPNGEKREQTDQMPIVGDKTSSYRIVEVQVSESDLIDSQIKDFSPGSNGVNSSVVSKNSINDARQQRLLRRRTHVDSWTQVDEDDPDLSWESAIDETYNQGDFYLSPTLFDSSAKDSGILDQCSDGGDEQVWTSVNTNSVIRKCTDKITEALPSEFDALTAQSSKHFVSNEQEATTSNKQPTIPKEFFEEHIFPSDFPCDVTQVKQLPSGNNSTIRRSVSVCQDLQISHNEDINVDNRKPLPSNSPGPSGNIPVAGLQGQPADNMNTTESEVYDRIVRIAENISDWSYGEDQCPPPLETLQRAAAMYKKQFQQGSSTSDSHSSDESYLSAREEWDGNESAPVDKTESEDKESDFPLHIQYVRNLGHSNV